MAEREEEKVTPPGTQLFSELVEDESVSGVREGRGSEKGSKQREEREREAEKEAVSYESRQVEGSK